MVMPGATVVRLIGLAMLTAIIGRSAPAQTYWTVGRDQEVMAVDNILTQLQTPISMRLEDKTLEHVIASLSEKIGVQFSFDKKWLEESGIHLDRTITLKASGVSAEAALTQMLEQVELTWTIANEAVVITSPEGDATHVMIRVYPVADLIGADDAADSRTRNSGDYDELIDLITSSISPTRWDENGGQGSISCFSRSRSLVITQTLSVHREVESLLAKLRATRDALRHKIWRPSPGSGDALKIPSSQANGVTIDEAPPAWRLPRTY